MKNVHPIFQNILKSHQFGNGRSFEIKEMTFVDEGTKQAYLKSYEWLCKINGYGASVVNETLTTLQIRVYNSCN